MELQDKANEFSVFIKRLIVGAQDVYFRDVIKDSTGFEVLKVEGEHLKIALLIKDYLKKHLREISKEVEVSYTGRANELSNFLEKIVSTHLKRINNLFVSTPSIGKRAQSAGYPDRIINSEGSSMYVEFKSSQEKTANSSLRTFYFKPSDKGKITMSCPHILIGFKVKSLSKNNNESPFIVNDFKIVDLYNLKVNLKPEFNASNPMIYQNCKEI